MASVSRSRTPRTCGVLAVAALGLRLALAMRPAAFLDRLFVPDDTYYTLSIARSIARGLGPSTDGIHLTSGFQPLLAFLVAPLLRLHDDPDFAFRTALVIGAISDAVTAWLVGHLAFRTAERADESRARVPKAAAIIATGAWGVSSAAIATSLNGLETSLALACTLGALAAWIEARERGTARAWLLAGALLGLCLFARVDTVFFVALVGVATLARAGVRATLLSIGGALVSVGPWWAYALSRFGSIVPESGAAVREQTLMYKAMGMNVRDQLAWAAGSVVGPPFFDSAWLREALGSGASAIGCALGVAFVVGALFVARQARHHDALRVLALFAACLFLFYGLYLPATWFFRRYLVAPHAFVALVVATTAAKVWSDRHGRPRLARAILVAGLACGALALVSVGRFATSKPTITVDQRHHGAKGYAEPARQILALAPPGAVIGSFQSGALTWFADGSGKTVVNLDGVVDGDAARAVREHRIAAFARSRGVTHLADWTVNAKLFVARSGDPRIRRRRSTRSARPSPKERMSASSSTRSVGLTDVEPCPPGCSRALQPNAGRSNHSAGSDVRRAQTCLLKPCYYYTNQRPFDARPKVACSMLKLLAEELIHAKS